MAEPLKNLINVPLIEAASAPLARAWPAFDASRFVAVAAGEHHVSVQVNGTMVGRSVPRACVMSP
jgi:hypothetical protein